MLFGQLTSMRPGTWANPVSLHSIGRHVAETDGAGSIWQLRHCLRTDMYEDLG